MLFRSGTAWDQTDAYVTLTASASLFSGSTDVGDQIVFTAVPGDATAIAAGELDLSVGFMRGQVKVAGDPGALLRVLPMVSGRAPVLPVDALLPR